MFDGSSIAGWKAINESDMVLMPDPDSAYMDPFFGASTLAINCDVLDPLTYQPYSRDPRTIAKKAEAYVKALGIGDSVYFGPEPEFFIFDDVAIRHHLQGEHSRSTRANCRQQRQRIRSSAITATTSASRGLFPGAAARQRPGHARRNAGGDGRHGRADRKAPPTKWPRPSTNSASSSARSSRAADSVQIYKYVIQQVANAYGKTVTFMPKPVYGDNGSGMHCHQSIWKDGKPLFAGDQYAGLSMDPSTTSAASSSTPRPSMPSPTRPPTATSAWCRASKPPCCWPIRPVPVGLLPYPVRPVAQGQARRSALPRSLGEPLSRLCRHADGRHRRHQEQDPSRRADGQGSLRLPKEELKLIPTVCVRSARRSRNSTRTASS